MKSKGTDPIWWSVTLFVAFFHIVALLALVYYSPRYETVMMTIIMTVMAGVGFDDLI